ncbi:OLC1v1014027C1 [Oldenlandia corymbosa var. corymbosa]|uniref:OLC1v1014027C1 n=1 Tax=Oldenlandia corymbosa var. corymbosa TaxID=529605 RepID=A0AAV1DZP3_OLDCO|nr:OLC1v1014027C1 [Oldenlandia corymbosa var. corymbosa]
MAFFINLCSLFSTFLFTSTFLIHVHVTSAQSNIVLANFTKLPFPTNVGAGGSLAFDALEKGPYAGTTDGRILYFSRFLNTWLDYAYTSPNRHNDGTLGYDRSPTCGFTLGLSFKPFVGLYACDPFVGLTFVLAGGPAITLVRNSDASPPLKFANSVDAASDGMVYFTDTSSVYGPPDAKKSMDTMDASGRLFQYNPTTKKLTTLLSQLEGPVGLATNINASFLLVTEALQDRILRYWLTGQKAGTSELFLSFGGAQPSKIKRTQEGNFWVGINNKTSTGAPFPLGIKFSPEGELLAVVDFSKEYQRRITNVLQQGNELFVAGVNASFIGRYELQYN